MPEASNKDLERTCSLAAQVLLLGDLPQSGGLLQSIPKRSRCEAPWMPSLLQPTYANNTQQWRARMKTDLFLVTIGVVLAASAAAEDLRSAPTQIDCDLPPAVKDAVNATAPPADEVFNVAGDENFMGQVLRYERIQFASSARLILNSELDFVVIAADELLFSPPLQTAAISLTPVAPQHGADGDPGPPVADRGRHGHNGDDGRNGKPGRPGTDGGEVHLPDVYILANSVQAQNPPSEFSYFEFVVDGIDGGNGGDGGRGGNGSRGGPGGKARDGAIGCDRGGGDGGDGGRGGPGGKPGNGGKAGDGADLLIGGPGQAVDLLKFSIVGNLPGAAGIGGESGASGAGGRGGSRGSGSKKCSGGDSGDKGAKPARTRPLNGSPGNEGAKC